MNEHLEKLILCYSKKSTNIYDSIDDYIKKTYTSSPDLSFWLTCPFCNNKLYYATAYPIVGCKHCSPQHNWISPLIELYPLGPTQIKSINGRKFSKKTPPLAVIDEYARIYIDYLEKKEVITESDVDWITSRLLRADRGQIFQFDMPDYDSKKIDSSRKISHTFQIKQLYLNAYFGTFASYINAQLHILTAIHFEHLPWFGLFGRITAENHQKNLSNEMSDEELLANSFLFTEAVLPLTNLNSLYSLTKCSELKYPQGIQTLKTDAGVQFSITRGRFSTDYYGFTCTFRSFSAIRKMGIESFLTPAFCPFDGKWFMNFSYNVDLRRSCGVNFDYTQTGKEITSNDDQTISVMLNFECTVPEDFQQFICSLASVLRGFGFKIRPVVFNKKSAIFYYKQTKCLAPLCEDNPVSFF